MRLTTRHGRPQYLNGQLNAATRLLSLCSLERALEPVLEIRRQASLHDIFGSRSYGTTADGLTPTNRHRNQWLFFSPQDDLEIRKLRSEGYNFREIGEKLSPSRSYYSIYLRVTKHLDPHRDSISQVRAKTHFSPEDDRKMVQLRNDGCTFQDIAMALNPQRSLHSVYGRLRSLSITPPDEKSSLQEPSMDSRRRGFSKEEDDLILRLRAEGLTFQAIHTRLRSTRSLSAIGARHQAITHNFHNRRLPFSAEDDDTILKHISDGYTYAAIGQKLTPPRRYSSVRQRYLVYLKPSLGSHTPSAVTSSSSSSTHPRNDTFWTHSDDKKLLRLYESGRKLSSLTTDLGRSRGSIYSRYYWVLKSSRPRPPEWVPYRKRARRRIQKISVQDAMTVVYLRHKLKMKWLDIGRRLPHRLLRTLRHQYKHSWFALYKDEVDQNPRQSSAQKPISVPLRNFGAEIPSPAGGLLSKPHTSRGFRAMSSHGFVSRRFYASDSQRTGQFSPEESENFERIRANGATIPQIAVSMGKSYPVVRDYIFRLNRDLPLGPQRGQRYSHEEADGILTMRARGVTAIGIAESTGRTLAGIQSFFRAHRVPQEQPSTSGKRLKRRPWGADEKHRIVQLTRSKSMTYRQIAEHFPNRTLSALKHKLTELREAGLASVAPCRKHAYTRPEDTVLLELRAAGKTTLEIAEFLGNRSRTSVLNRFMMLKMQTDLQSSHTNSKSTEREAKSLVRTANSSPPSPTAGQASALLPKRVRPSAAQRAKNASISSSSGKRSFATDRPPARKGWSAEEDKMLLEMRAEGRTIRDIGSALNKTRAQVNYRCCCVLHAPPGISRSADSWSPEEYKNLLDMKSEGRSSIDIALALKRPLQQVTKRLYHVMSSKPWDTGRSPGANRAWTAEEIELLSVSKEQGCAMKEIARRLGRSLYSVFGRNENAQAAKRVGNPWNPWTAEETERLINIYKRSELTLGQIAELFPGRSRAACKTKYELLVTSGQAKPVGKLLGRYSDAEDKTIMDMRAAGRTWTEIAAQLENRSQSSLKYRFRVITVETRNEARSTGGPDGQRPKTVRLKSNASDTLTATTKRPTPPRAGVSSRRSYATQPPAARNRNPITPEERAQIVALRLKDNTSKVIAMRLGRSQSTVASVCQDRGSYRSDNKKPRWTTEDLQKVVTWLEVDGCSSVEAGELLGRTSKSINSKYRRLCEARHIDPVRLTRNLISEADKDALALSPGKGRNWSSTENSVVATLTAKGKTLRQIATYLGRSVSSVSKSRQSLGMTQSQRWPKEEVEDVMRLREVERLSFVEIEKRLTRSKRACASQYKRACRPQQRYLIFSKPEFTPEESNSIVELRKLGKSYQEIADVLNRSMSGVYKQFLRLCEQRGIEARRNANEWTPEKDSSIVELRKLRKSYDEIAGNKRRKSKRGSLSRFRTNANVSTQWRLI